MVTEGMKHFAFTEMCGAFGKLHSCHRPRWPQPPYATRRKTEMFRSVAMRL